jgi:NAD(P)-dependent dehydrogenase (short-subunit alcohol dehydrogenase family)
MSEVGAPGERVLEGLVALITGGTQGIGLGIAEGYLEAGASVMVVGRDPDKLADVVERLGKLGPIAGVSADVAVVAETRKIVEATIDAFGRLDVLANVAGVFSPSSMLETTEEQFDYQFGVNVKGSYFCTQAAVPAMLASSGRGKVINISSTAGQRGFAGVSVYCTTKAAVDHMTRVFAAELAPLGINVNCIVPGNIDMPTNVLMKDPGAREATAAGTPARRNGFPADINPAAVYLASAAADFLHGAAIVIDGGILASG